MSSIGLVHSSEVIECAGINITIQYKKVQYKKSFSLFENIVP